MVEIARWKLQSLGYPRAKEMKLEDEQEVMNLVLYLENRCVRLLDVGERKPLEGAPRPAWHTFFASYLFSAGCPLLGAVEEYSREHMDAYLHWLVGHAVSLDYEEAWEGLNRDAGEALAIKAQGGSGSGGTSSATSGSAGSGSGSGGGEALPPAAVAMIAELAQVCHVSGSGRSSFELLQAVGRALRQRLLPAIAASDAAVALQGDEGGSGSGAAGSGSGSGSGVGGNEKVAAALAKAAKDPMSSLSAFSGGDALPPPGARRAIRRLGKAMGAAGAGGEGEEGGGAGGGTVVGRTNLADFPLGFDTGKAVVDYAAALLRMLYIADLRELQDAVNEILITVQEFTSDPKTDSALGKVGR